MRSLSCDMFRRSWTAMRISQASFLMRALRRESLREAVLRWVQMTVDFVLPASADRSNAAKLAALGAITGALSWTLVNFARELNLDFEVHGTPLLLLPLSVYPGLLFGLVFSVFFYRRASLTRGRAMGYVIAALVAYLAAFHVAFYSIANGFDNSDSPLAYGASGVAGGLAGA